MDPTLCVACEIDRETATIIKFGPTSYDAGLLSAANWRHGDGLIAVLPVMDGGLLRVRARDVRDAIAYDAEVRAGMRIVRTRARKVVPR